MAERTTPVSITRAPRLEPPEQLASAIGDTAAGILSHLIDVVDREDRLESGSGRFRQDLAADDAGRRQAVEDAVLRALRMAADPINYRILDSLADSGQSTTTALGQQLGLPRLAIEERISDLVSAGLAAKVFSSGRVSGTDAGAALVALIRQAVGVGSTGLNMRSEGHRDSGEKKQ